LRASMLGCEDDLGLGWRLVGRQDESIWMYLL